VSIVKFKRIPALSKSDEDRFWLLVKKVGRGRDYWLWNGSRNSKAIAASLSAVTTSTLIAYLGYSRVEMLPVI